MEHTYFKRIWAEIDLDALKHNVQSLRKIIGDSVGMMAVIKADAYGHGVEVVSRTLAGCGVDYFAVSSLSEAIQLRKFGHALPILILGYTPTDCVKELCEYDLSQAVYSLPYAQALSTAAEAAGCTLNGHLKLDVGMGRLGLRAEDPDCVEQGLAICRLPHLNIKGIFTHFPSADADGDPDGSVTRKQIALFTDRVKALEENGVSFTYRHCCNSAASLAFPQGYADMVREGICLYGLSPSAALEGKADLRPVMQLKTVVSMVKTLKKGSTVSYGRTYTLPEDRTVATVCIGYADGYPRSLSGKGYMLVNGRKAPVIGRVCMDQLMLDVTGIPDVSMGSVVTVFGEDHGITLPAGELAALGGTIHYELVCVLGKRVPRVYFENGVEVSVTNYVG